MGVRAMIGNLKRRKFMICRFGLMLCLATAVAFGQSLSQLIADLDSPDPTTRSQAFYALQAGGQADVEPARTAIINLLATETTYVNSQASTSQPTISDDYSTYYGNVALVVGSFHDARAIDNLMAVIERGNIPIAAVASFGRVALDRVILKLSAGDSIQKLASALTIIKMLDPANSSSVADAISQMKIRAALTRVSGQSDTFLQKAAAKGLALMSTTAVMGDANGDGKVDCFDVALVRAAFGATSTQTRFNPEADLNLDGAVDVRDLAIVSQRLPTGTHCQ